MTQRYTTGDRIRVDILDETDPDHAWVDVAEAVDRDPATVREVVLWMYDGDSGDHADVTHRFLADLVPIEERLRER